MKTFEIWWLCKIYTVIFTTNRYKKLRCKQFCENYANCLWKGNQQLKILKKYKVQLVVLLNIKYWKCFNTFLLKVKPVLCSSAFEIIFFMSKKKFQTFLNRLLDFPWRLNILDSLNRILIQHEKLTWPWSELRWRVRLKSSWLLTLRIFSDRLLFSSSMGGRSSELDLLKQIW